MHGPMGESTFTKAVNSVVEYIQNNTPIKDSLFEQAQYYFDISFKDKKSLLDLHAKVENIKTSVQTADRKTKIVIHKKLDTAQRLLKKENTRQQQTCTLRSKNVKDLCTRLLMLSEADSWQETQVNSAKLLGTLQLLSPGEGTKLAQQNQRFKPAYKGVIALRLLDKQLKEGKINNQYINERYQERLRYSEQEGDLTLFQRDVAIPVLTAALFQDVGLLHPKAQLILKGEDGTLDEFRTLEIEERRALLKINHEKTLDFITYGLGMEQYIGNSKQERTNFDLNEKEKLIFIRTLLIDALKPKLGDGNLIKIPQIYASVIFSSKQNYNFLDLPKAGLVITRAAAGGSICKVYADSLLSIVGHFPQGFGITYIPKNDDKQDMERYEYAIVTGLNPSDPYIPRCRVATRNLTFIAGGHTKSINIESNLYFSVAKRKLEIISPARLEEILSKLASNFEERKTLDLIPSYWNPYGFFCYKKLQNLWNKA
ncbi:MAG: hypothetical protein ACI936_000114 [Paraglaciecola sp.]|jgi:hypothetical protein